MEALWYSPLFVVSHRRRYAPYGPRSKRAFAAIETLYILYALAVTTFHNVSRWGNLGDVAFLESDHARGALYYLFYSKWMLPSTVWADPRWPAAKLRAHDAIEAAWDALWSSNARFLRVGTSGDSYGIWTRGRRARRASLINLVSAGQALYDVGPPITGWWVFPPRVGRRGGPFECLLRQSAHRDAIMTTLRDWILARAPPADHYIEEYFKISCELLMDDRCMYDRIIVDVYIFRLVSAADKSAAQSPPADSTF